MSERENKKYAEPKSFKMGKRAPKSYGRSGERFLGELREGNVDTVEVMIKRGIQIKTDQERQLDWAKVDRSSYCADYENRKRGVEMEAYWEEPDIKADIEETWARLRCGNVGSDARKRFGNTKCIISKEEEECLAHIVKCKGARERMRHDLVCKLDEWITNAKDWQLGKKIDCCLRGKPVPATCNYIKEFERLGRQERENAKE